jgi:hypothetical protein
MILLNSDSDRLHHLMKWLKQSTDREAKRACVEISEDKGKNDLAYVSHLLRIYYGQLWREYWFSVAYNSELEPLSPIFVYSSWMGIPKLDEVAYLNVASIYGDSYRFRSTVYYFGKEYDVQYRTHPRFYKVVINMHIIL